MKNKPHLLFQPTILWFLCLAALIIIHPAIADSSDSKSIKSQKSSHYRFEHLTPEEGLPSLAVQAILQDSQGFIWFGTFNGLFRWDGYHFQGFQHDPDDPRSLSASNVITLFEDQNNTLWVGTVNGGINRFDRDTERFAHFRNIPDNPDSLSHNQINAIAAGHDGGIWIGTDNGLNYLNLKENRFIRSYHNPADIESLSSNQIQVITPDSDGNLWIGSQNAGLNKFDPTTQRSIRFKHHPTHSNSLCHDRIGAIAIDKAGILWIGTGGGLNRFDPERGLFRRYQHDPDNGNSLSDNDISAILIDSDNILWIGTTGKGLNRFDPDKEIFTRFYNIPGNESSFRGNWIDDIYADRTGVLWFATLTGGVNKLDRGTTKFDLFKHDPADPSSLSHNSPWAVYQDGQGEIWIGTIGGGLNHFDPDSGQFRHYKNNPHDPHSLSDDQVFAITEDRQSDLWIGTRGGLNRLNRKSQKFTRYIHEPGNPDSLSENWTSSLYADQKGRVWIGSFGGGLDLFEHSTEKFRNYRHNANDPNSLSSNKIISIVGNNRGTLWLATHEGGLNKFNPEKQTFKHYRYNPERPDSISSDQVMHMALDDNTLWLATSSGLDKLNLKTDTIVHYREKNGLPDNNVVSIVPDEKGNLWLGMHGGGLSRFNIETETFKNFDRKDGLQSDEFSPQGAIRDRNGTLYFTGKSGLNVFKPDQIIDNPHMPPVVLTDFLVFNSPVSVGNNNILNKVINETDAITLTHKESVFSIEFAALNYRSPSKNRYAYKLEGFDRDWNFVDSTRRFATYTNLDPGAYTFRVKGSNNDGLWNETGKKIKITITPPWWNTWWFYLQCTVASLGILTIIYRARTRQLAAERSVALTIKESEERLREIASNIPGVIFQFARKKDGSEHVPYFSEKSNILFDLPAEQLITDADNIYGVIVEEDRDAFAKSIDTSAKSLTPWHESFRIKSVNKGIRWITGAAIPRRLENGDLLWNGVFLDVTEQKKAEEALKESEEKYRKVVDNAIEGICVIQDSRFKYFNSRALDLFGYTAEELPQIEPVETVFPEDRPLVASMREKQIQREQAINTYTHRIITKNGNIRWAEVKAVTITWEKHPAVLTFLTDITERKRTEELMIQTEKMMSVGGLAAGMAHELNNPLGAMLQGVQNIERRLSPTLKANHTAAGELDIDLTTLELYLQKRGIIKTLEGVRKSGRRASEIISNMLQFSRKSESNMAPSNLAELIENVLELAGKDYSLKNKYDFRNIRIVKEFDPDLPLVPCIQTELEQVILNLVINAAWAMADGGKAVQSWITIRLGVKNSMANIEVEDNGPGMDEETRKRLFEPFYTTKPVGEGTGLGLSVSYMIISNNHKGSMEVESKSGMGTRFIIRLPLEQA